MLLLTDTSQKDSNWAGGKFYQTDHVIVWNEAGTVFIYKLPSRAIRPVDHTDSSWTAEPAICRYSFSTGDTPVLTHFTHTNNLSEHVKLWFKVCFLSFAEFSADHHCEPSIRTW